MASSTMVSACGPVARGPIDFTLVLGVAGVNMKLSRRLALKIHFVLDELFPPILRDSAWFMALPFRLLFGDKASVFANFKKRAMGMSEREVFGTYSDTRSVHIDRVTDLNDTCLNEILDHIVGKRVLDVACGRGHLATKLAQKHDVTAADLIINDALIADRTRPTLVRCNVERLPFRDAAFDTVVSAHTLEHVRNIADAIAELRRVTNARLVVVVPKQREYRHTFDLHLHFFPYEHSLLAVMGANLNNTCKQVAGDLLYVEDKHKPSTEPNSVVAVDGD